jgi:hypothetical protein
MLFPLNKTKYLESSQGCTRPQGSSSCSNPQAYCAGTEPIPSRGSAATTRRQRLKRCHPARDRRVSDFGSGQRPRAPRANSVADNVVALAGGRAATMIELQCYK